MSKDPQPVIRSYLYVPADSGHRLAKAGTRGAEAVIADLEDSVPPARKEVARRAAAAWISEGCGSRGFERWLRLNPGSQGIADLHSVFRPGLDGICLAKTSGADEVEAAADALSHLESQYGCRPGATAIMPLIESGLGLRRADEIADAPRVRALQLGEIDLAADLGLPYRPHPEDLAPIRLRIVIASAAAGLQQPVGAVSPQFRDIPTFRSDTKRLRQAGFLGRAAIHPSQIPVIHDVFAVSAEELAAAKAAVSRYDAALAAGEGASTDQEGVMVDEATVRSSRRLIALAQACGVAEGGA